MGFLELVGSDPAVLYRRVDVGRLGSRAADTGEAIGPVVGLLHRASFLAELGERPVAQCQARLVEGVEVLENQKRNRLPKIERGLAGGAEEVAGIKLGNPDWHPHEIVGRHDRGWLRRSVEQRQIEAGEDMGRVVGPKQQRVRSPRRPAGHVRGAKIGWVELSSGDLGDAVNAAGGCRGGVPLTPAGQRLARVKPRFFGGRQAGESQRDAARGACLEKRTTRNAAQSSVGAIQIGHSLRHCLGQRDAAKLETQDETLSVLTDARTTGDRGASALRWRRPIRRDVGTSASARTAFPMRVLYA